MAASMSTHPPRGHWETHDERRGVDRFHTPVDRLLTSRGSQLTAANRYPMRVCCRACEDRAVDRRLARVGH
jgi:hypothetical protein